MSTSHLTAAAAAERLRSALETATASDERLHAMWKTPDGSMVLARPSATAPDGHGLVDLAFGRPGEDARDLAEEAVDPDRWTTTSVTIDEAIERHPLGFDQFPSQFDRTPADGWSNVFRASSGTDQDRTPSPTASDHAIDVLTAQLQQPRTNEVAWVTDRDPTNPDGPRAATDVVIKTSKGRADGLVDLYVKQPHEHGAGFSWFLARDIDHDTLRRIAPLHPDHVAQHGALFDRVATERGTPRDVDRVAGRLADAMHQSAPGRDRGELLVDAHRAIDGAASVESRTAALRWLTSSLDRDVRLQLSTPTGAELLKTSVNDALEVARTRVRPLKSALYAVRQDPTQDRDRAPTITR